MGRNLTLYPPAAFIYLSMHQPKLATNEAPRDVELVQSIYYSISDDLLCVPFAWFTIIVIGVRRDSYHNDMKMINRRDAIASYTCDRAIHNLMRSECQSECRVDAHDNVTCMSVSAMVFVFVRVL
jgi:hypothetical protein